MKNPIYVYSGIQPGKKGAGNFVSYFLGQLQTKGVEYKLISYHTPEGFFVKIAKRLGVIRILKRTYYLLAQNISKNKNKTKGKKVVLFHPQSIGLDICIEIIQSNQIYLYVLDNFLFCKKSYNYLEGTKPCTLCIDDPEAHKKKGCEFFPNQQEQEVYDLFLRTIQENLTNIHFLTQNKNQGLLLKKKFGPDISLSSVGMLIDLEETKEVANTGMEQYDFLYHNTLSGAKGLNFFLDIAKILKDYSFVVPYSKSEVRKIIPNLEDLTNVKFLSLTWESGLSRILESCKVVVNPSLWSSPVEGALLKSINHNGCVAVVPSEYSFPAELPADVLIKLSTDPEEAAKILTEVMEKKEMTNNYRMKSKEWLDIYIGHVESSLQSYIEGEFV